MNTSKIHGKRFALTVLGLLVVLSGAVRLMFERNTTAFAEEKATASESEPTALSKFGLVVLDLPSGYQAVRWNRQTGAAWSVHNNTIQWISIKEAEPVQPGRYEVKFSSWTKDNATVFIALRFDSESGKTWYLSNGAWSLLKEPTAS